MDNPAIFAQRAVDLGEVKDMLEAREAAAEQATLEREQQEIIEWDQAMTRAFKGIMPRSTRMIFMRVAARKAEREGLL